LVPVAELPYSGKNKLFASTVSEDKGYN